MYTKRISALALAFVIGIATWASEQHRHSQDAIADESAEISKEMPVARPMASADC